MIMFQNTRNFASFCYLLSTLLLLSLRVRTVSGVVKIEVSPLKSVNSSMAPTVNEPEINLPATVNVQLPTTTTTTTTTTTEKAKTKDKVAKANETTTTASTTLNSTITTQTTTLNTSVTNSTKTLTDANSTQISLVNRALFNDTLHFLNQYTQRKLRRDQLISSYYCPCDLKINYCDVNCCCDVDCVSPEVRQTFKCNDQSIALHDYDDMATLQSCSVSSTLSLLCVVDRKPRLYGSDNTKQIKVEFQQVARYSWTNRFETEPVKSTDSRAYYKAGDRILVWNEVDKDIRSLEIPRSLTGNRCGFKIPIKHLADIESKCLRTIDEHEKFTMEFEERLRQLKIIKTPPTIPISTIPGKDLCNNSNPHSKNDSSNCIDIQIFHCNEMIAPKHCMNNGTDFDDTENLLAKSIQIRFDHNFTSILKCTVFFVYGTHADDTAWSKLNVLQTIRVEYSELNETYAERSVHRVSGNIGYLQHNPVIITKHIPITTDEKSDKVEKVLGYFHENITFCRDEHYIRIPKIDRNNFCIINNYTYDMVDFDVNLLMRCKVALLKANNSIELVDDLKSDPDKNLTVLCRSFQKTILHYLIYDLDLEQENSTVYDKLNVLVSEFGNPKNESRLWTRLKVQGAPVKLDEIVASDYDEVLNSFTCKNMFLNVRYEFFFGRLRVGDIPHQALIKDANIKFGPKTDLKVKLNGDLRPVYVYLDVMFHDFTTSIMNQSYKVSYSLVVVSMSLMVFFCF